MKMKIVVIGEPRSGKSSIIRRYCHGVFDDNPNHVSLKFPPATTPKQTSTILLETLNQSATVSNKCTIKQECMEFAIKRTQLDWDKDIRVKMVIWDARGPFYRQYTRDMQFRDTDGAVLVLDITSLDDVDIALKLKGYLDDVTSSENRDRVPCLLLASKCDLVKEPREQTRENLEKLCKDNGLDDWVETSAMLNTNIDESFQLLLRKIIMAQKQTPSETTDSKASAAETKMTARASDGNNSNRN